MQFFRKEGVVLLTSVIGVIILFRSLIGHDLDTTLWADSYDSKLIYWIVSWGYHSIIELKQPGLFWHANSFFPHSYALAFSDGLLGLQPLFVPLRLLEFSTLAALYLSLALLCLCAALFTNIALNRIGGFSTIERAFIIYASHFGMPMVNFLVHYQLFGFQLAVPFILFTYLYLLRWQLQDLIAASALFTWGVLIATYLAPMLSVFAFMLTLTYASILIYNREFWTKIRPRFSRIVSVLVPTAILLYLLQFHAYFAVFESAPENWVAEASTYAAHPLSLLTGFSQSSLLYHFKSGDPWFGAGERAYFPGILLLAMSFISLTLWTKLDKSLRDLRLFALIIMGTSIVMSWGPVYRFEPSIKLPFYYIAEIIPGLSSVRTPGRFGMLLGLPLSLLSIMALRSLRPIRYRSWTVIILILVAVESISLFKTYHFEISPTYEKVAAHLEDDSVLIELPIADTQDLRVTLNVVNHLIGSTKHWANLVVGYGARKTQEMNELLRIDAELMAGKPAIQELLNFAQRLKVQNLLIHLNRYPKITRVRWRKFMKSSQSGTMVKQFENSYLIKLNGVV